MKRSLLVLSFAAAVLIGSVLNGSTAPAPAGCNCPDCGTGLDDAPPCPDGPDGPADAPRLARLARVLELSEAQQVQIRELFSAERERLAPLRQQARENRAALQRAERTVPFDEAAVRAIAARQAAVDTELLISRTRMHTRIEALLTPEQRQLAEKLRPAPGEGRGGRHRGHGPRD